MTVQWEKVYVFISSTFNDMHAERDMLVKQVFPQLQEWCEKRKLRLVDIDLRWGVTEADATQNKRVVQICLDRIDKCRPFFLCFLGQRRGWVPDRDDISDETYARYPDLVKYAGAASITEMEILHALVNPMHQGVPHPSAELVERFERVKYAFFYLRQPEYLLDLPADPSLLRHVYTHEAIENPTEREKAEQELRRWREVEIPATRRPVHAYQAHWKPEEVTPEICLPIRCPSTTEPGSPIWERSFTNWAEQWNQVGVLVDKTGEISDPLEREKAEQYNARLRQGRLGNFTCETTTLAERVIADLKQAIQERYPDHVESTHLTPLQRELDQQEQFLQSANAGFIERTGDFTALDEYLRNNSRKLFVLTAPGGMGKTSLLARWIDRVKPELTENESLHYRFIGASDGSTAVDILLRSVLREIREISGKFSEDIPLDPNKMRMEFPHLLEAAGEKGKTIIILDGLNQLERKLSDLAWLPLMLPKHVKLVVSFKRGEEQAENYYQQLQARGNAILAKVQPFKSLGDRRQLVEVYLSQFLKELDDRYVETLIQSEGASNPLYLKVVLAELRVFGTFVSLGEKIQADFGSSPISAFLGMLKRLESDPTYTRVQLEQLVPRVFGWLAHAHQGLNVEELSGLLIQEELFTDDQKAVAAVYGLLRQVRPYMAHRDGRLGFFFESFRLAVLTRYRQNEEKQVAFHREARLTKEWHASLAEYFVRQPLRLGTEHKPNQHKLTELAFQLASSGQAEVLRKMLWDYVFIEARLEGANIETLIADYDLINLPEAGIKPDDAKNLRILQDTLKLSQHVLSESPLQLPSQLTGRLLGFKDGELRRLLDQIRVEVKRPWLRPRHACFFEPGGALQRTLVGHSDHVTGVALTLDGHFAVSVASDKTLKVWDVDSGKCLRTIQGNTESINVVALTPDGCIAVSASSDKTLKVWDVASGACLRVLRGHTENVNDLALTADGCYAISASSDKTLKVWEVASGKCLHTLKGHTNGNGANNVALTADGHFCLSASGNTLTVWNVAKGTCLRTLKGHITDVNCVALTPDGRCAVSASDHTLKVWDVASGKCLRTLEGHTEDINDVALTANGFWAVSVSSDKTLKVWDVTSGTCLRTFHGHTIAVQGLALTPDGHCAITASENLLRVWNLDSGEHIESQSTWNGHGVMVSDVVLTPNGTMAVSVSNDRMLKVWDVASGKYLRTLKGHSREVNGVVMMPDSRHAISASGDHTLKVWNLDGGECLRTMRGDVHIVQRVALSPDGCCAVSAGLDGTLAVWDIVSGKCLRTLQGHTRGVTHVALTLDGRCAVSAGKDDTLKVWDVASGKCLRTLRGFTTFLVDVADVILTPDGCTVVSACYDSLKVWNVASGECLHTMQGHTGNINDIVLTPDGCCAVTASWDGTLKVWDMASGECLRTLHGHTACVSSAAMTQDGRTIISASRDETLKVWDIESGTCLATLTAEYEMSRAIFSSNDLLVMASSYSGAIYSLHLENVTSASPILTAWNGSFPWSFWKKTSLAFGCTHCRTWSKIPKSTLGTEIPCPRCGKPVRLNPFTIEADWRPIAKAWKGN